MKYKEGPGSWINVNLIKRLLHFMLIKCKFYHHSLIRKGYVNFIFSLNDWKKYLAIYFMQCNSDLSGSDWRIKRILLCVQETLQFSRLDKRLWIWWSSPSARAGTRGRRGRRWSWRSTWPAAAAVSQARRRPASPSQCLTPPPVSASAPSSSGGRSVRHVWRDQVSGRGTCWWWHDDAAN